jgi:(4-(4-[2-(gamma-L-glutamylamino)ethyl]phenoxymethyl)furan-2-yl)methanamine synthase
MTEKILGWDVGGANLKAACLSRSFGEVTALERPFALWRSPEELSSLLCEVADALGGDDADMALTMTAELADCFPTRREGVLFVIDAFRSAFPHAGTWVWGLDGRFRTVSEAREAPLEVASANWLASATRMAGVVASAVFLDVGSTTSDVVPIVDCRVVASGRTDTQRLASGELVYTGALRTSVPAIVRSVPLHGGVCRVAAENFAVAADVHLWLGHITEADYTCETPDGRGRSRTEAGARLARVVCADRETLNEDEIDAIARHVAGTQIDQIADAIRQVRGRLEPRSPTAAVVAGSGAFLAAAAAGAAGLEVNGGPEHLAAEEARIGPAAAVARLLRDWPGCPR